MFYARHWVQSFTFYYLVWFLSQHYEQVLPFHIYPWENLGKKRLKATSSRPRSTYQLGTLILTSTLYHPCFCIRDPGISPGLGSYLSSKCRSLTWCPIWAFRKEFSRRLGEMAFTVLMQKMVAWKPLICSQISILPAVAVSIILLRWSILSGARSLSYNLPDVWHLFSLKALV